MIKQPCEMFNISTVLTALQQEFSATANYSTLREQLPRRLVELLMCHTVLVYLRVNDTLQLASSSCDDQSSWPSAWSVVAHPNPIISIESTAPEARAWRNQHTVYISDEQLASIATPLIYRQQSIGVLVAIRDCNENKTRTPVCWHSDEVESLAAIAGVIALLFEHTRLLEHDRERIHELSLLNSISSQMNSLYERDHLRNIIIQRTKEICAADLCEMLEPTHPPDISSWVSSALHEQLFAWYRTQHAPVPLVIERHRSTDGSHFDHYFALLPTSIKTFIALPLLSAHTPDKRNSGQISIARKVPSTANILGIIAGGYHDARKVQQTELSLLQSLASQAGAALENMYLMAEVIEARNEARMLLRRVVDDQRLKELILESIPSGLITTDQEGRITIFNRAAATMLGYHPYEVLGLPLRKFLSLPNKEFGSLEQTSASSVENEPSHKVEQQTVVINDRLERKRILEVQSVPLYGDQGRHVGTLTTLNDLTSIYRLEEEKRHLDRLATLGEMAANVAHEVRNPLASIKTTIQMLRDDLAKSHFFCSESLLLGEQTTKDVENRVQESIIVMLKEVERLDAIVRDLLLFARPNQLHRALCNISELSDQILNQLQPQIVEANIVVHRIYEDVPPLWVDIGQMKQVLINLFINAIQAMPEIGVLTVACRYTSAEDTRSILCATTNAAAKTSYSSAEERQELPIMQQWLDLVVIDTGVGIAPENLHNVFQPFYTTKAHGIGLGLPITRRLIEDHGGQISIKSQLGYGATVSVRLPLHGSPLLKGRLIL
jgi:PAS domain S-box-containing protein